MKDTLKKNILNTIYKKNLSIKKSRITNERKYLALLSLFLLSGTLIYNIEKEKEIKLYNIRSSRDIINYINSFAQKTTGSEELVSKIIKDINSVNLSNNQIENIIKKMNFDHLGELGYSSITLFVSFVKSIQVENFKKILKEIKPNEYKDFLKTDKN